MTLCQIEPTLLTDDVDESVLFGGGELVHRSPLVDEVRGPSYRLDELTTCDCHFVGIAMDSGFGKYAFYYLLLVVGLSGYYLNQGENLHAIYVLVVASLIVLLLICGFIIDIANHAYSMKYSTERNKELTQEVLGVLRASKNEFR